jgi:hypothetical protein
MYQHAVLSKSKWNATYVGVLVPRRTLGSPGASCTVDHRTPQTRTWWIFSPGMSASRHGPAHRPAETDSTVFSTHKKRQSSSWNRQYRIQYTWKATIVGLKHTLPCSEHMKSANRRVEAHSTVFSTQKAPIVQLKHIVPCSVHMKSDNRRVEAHSTVFSTHKKRQSSCWSTQYRVQYTKSANRPAEAHSTVFSTQKKRQSSSWSTQYRVQYAQKAPIVQLKLTVPCSVHTQSFPMCASRDKVSTFSKGLIYFSNIFQPND